MARRKPVQKEEVVEPSAVEQLTWEEWLRMYQIMKQVSDPQNDQVNLQIAQLRLKVGEIVEELMPPEVRQQILEAQQQRN